MKFHLSHIAFELVSGCNLDCVFCYNIWKTPHSCAHPGQGSYRKSVRVLKQLFLQADIDHVTLTGGEPFLAERFIEVALMCRMEGKGVTVITNGTRGTHQQYRDLHKIGVGLFELPVHSHSAAVHDKMTGQDGSWERSVASIRFLRSLGAQVVAVVVLTRHNVEDIDRTLDFIASLGITRVMINRYNIGGRGVSDPLSVSATLSELRPAFDTIDRKAATSNLKITSNVCTPHCLLDPADYTHIGFGNCSPDPLRRPVTLDMDGNVRLCNHSPVVAGNIFDTQLEQILHSPYSLSWGETTPNLCSACASWEKCLGGCRAASEQCGSSLSEPDPIIALLR